MGSDSIDNFGLSDSGEYMVGSRLPSVIGGAFDLTLTAGDAITFDGLPGMAVSIGGGLIGMNVTSNMIGIIASMSGTGTASNYHFGVPQFATVTFPAATIDQIYTFDSSTVLPKTTIPYGNVALPSIINAMVDQASGTVKLSIFSEPPGQFVGTIEVFVVYPDGTKEFVKTLDGNFTGDIAVTPPDHINADGTHWKDAIASVSWQVVRVIPTDVLTSSGKLSGGEPIEFAGNTARINAKPDMAVVLTRTGIDMYRQDKLVGHTSLLTDNNQSLNLDYLTGSKVQPVVFSDDLSSIFVGGNGVVYVIDAMTFKLINTIKIPAGANISSLAATGHLLFIGEGQRGASNRLLVMDIRSGSAGYGKYISLKNTGIETIPYGVAGMVVGPDGRTLVVSAPINPNSVYLGDPNKRGDVRVFDLSSLNLLSGEIDHVIVAGGSGKSPQTITATKDADRYLVANIADYDHGLSTLVLNRDSNGKITSANMSAIDMSQPGSAVRIDRLDIQRAQSAVLVTVDGIEYAIVSDDNYHFLDPYWKAMYEAPNFLFTPNGPPIATGGSVSAKKVAVGGKLGIVKDPFGAAQYLGATLPLDGYGIVNLGVSEDGKVLIGQLKGSSSGDIFDLQTKPNQSHAWDVKALISAALGMSDADRMSKHIKLDAGVEQLIQDGTASVAGTFFDAQLGVYHAEGNYGDVIGVNLKELVGKQYVGTMNVKIDNFSIEPYNIKWLTESTNNAVGGASSISPLQLVLDKNKASKPIYSRTTVNGTDKADFIDTGVLFFAPQINGADLIKLRNGETLGEESIAFAFSYKVNGEDKHGIINVTAKDYANASNIFFGDRPLDNPGYSKFALSGSVGAGSGNTNDVLDVYRVEQRLKYLGFPAMHTGNSSLTNNTLKKFVVDGNFADQERQALKLFEKVVRYESTGVNTTFNNDLNGADGKIEADQSVGTQGGITTGWLNAYNAPHWMQLFSSTNPAGTTFKSRDPTRLPGWENSQTGSSYTNVENFGTSWLYDLMRAKEYAPASLKQTTSLFNGSVDANYGFTPKWTRPPIIAGQHATHDLGMAFDLGVSNYIDKNNAQLSNETLLTAISNLTNGTWSIANAIAYTQHILPGGATGLPNIQSPARARNDQVSAIRDFLSLYAMTKSDGVTAELQAKVVNTTAASLFGDMITGVHIGSGVSYQKKVNGVLQTMVNPLTGLSEPVMVTQNPYRNIREILHKLGISATPISAHHNHFHIYLKPPTPENITANLLADAAGADTATSQATDPQALLDYAQTLIEGEELMFTMDVHYVPAYDPPIVLAQAAAGSTTPPADFILNHCTETYHTIDPRSAFRVVDPAGMLGVFFASIGSKIDLAAIKITLLQGTQHGKITTEVDNTGLTFYGYDPAPGYLGDDQAKFMAEFEYDGKHYRTMIIMQIKVLETVDERSPSCPDPVMIKAPKPATGDSGYSSGYNLAAVSVTFADLPGAAVGQTVGAAITLDTNAAGYNWFIDNTPSQNEEWLPTSNPLRVGREGRVGGRRQDGYALCPAA